MLLLIISTLVIGLIAGFIARAAVPGPDSMSVDATILLGLIGSFIGGFPGWALFGKDLAEGALRAPGLVGSIIGAVIALLVYRAVSGRGRLARGL
jgi:uncharacterized membrane protein YeaQ/YmgE (transglycosylase-associated protein family)